MLVVPLTICIAVAILSVSCESKDSRVQENKKIAALIVEDVLEGKSLAEYAIKYMDPAVQVEYPEGFIIPILGGNQVKGHEEIIPTSEAWPRDTAHQAEIIEVVGEGDNVAVLASAERIQSRAQRQLDPPRLGN